MRNEFLLVIRKQKVNFMQIIATLRATTGYDSRWGGSFESLPILKQINSSIPQIM